MSLSNHVVAAIDMGTNSFHLIIVELLKNGKLKFLDRQREFLRLGSELGGVSGSISTSETIKAITVLKNYFALAKYHKAEIKIVATSAVREAKNQKEFIDKVFKETGIIINTIEGKEEAKLIYIGMKNALPISDKKVLCVDIGGGSTEFILAENGNPIFAESVKIGAVRLSKKFFPDYIITEKGIEQCSNFVEEQIKLNKNIYFDKQFDFAIGSSGTVDTICLIKQYQQSKNIKEKLNGCSFTDVEFRETYNMIMSLKTAEERLQIPGLHANRADIIPAGMIILKIIFELFSVKKMVLSEYALREGIIFNTISRMK
jgi:exopolyphosphatase/guanosine-5'-triphosphate,3'-diphosphate pyrophosphatase